MFSTVTRRELLAVGSLVGSGALAGCLADAGATTSTPRPCSVQSDRPTAEYGPSYPTLSGVDSPTLAMDFALEFEAAFQRNSVKVLEPEATYDRVVSTDTTEGASVERGYLVGVDVEVEYGREVHTSDDPDAESFRRRRRVTASYFVGDRALRVATEGLRVVDPRTSEDGEIVSCEA